MAKDDETWLTVAYVIFGLLVFYITGKAVELVGIQTGWLERYSWYAFARLAIALVVGIAATLILRSDKDRHEYYLASIAELRKVTWPSWPDVKRMTIIVCVVVGVFAVIVGLFDVVWSGALSWAIEGLT